MKRRMRALFTILGISKILYNCCPRPKSHSHSSWLLPRNVSAEFPSHLLPTSHHSLKNTSGTHHRLSLSTVNCTFRYAVKRHLQGYTQLQLFLIFLLLMLQVSPPCWSRVTMPSKPKVVQIKVPTTNFINCFTETEEPGLGKDFSVTTSDVGAPGAGWGINGRCRALGSISVLLSAGFCTIISDSDIFRCISKHA